MLYSMPITRADIKRIASLQDAKGRAEQGLMLLEGARLVGEGLKAGAVETVFVAEDWAGRAGIERAAGTTPVVAVPAGDLDRMVEVRTPAGVAATARLNRPRPAAELVAEMSR